jgi:hypothetical protein
LLCLYCNREQATSVDEDRRDGFSLVRVPGRDEELQRTR